MIAARSVNIHAFDLLLAHPDINLNHPDAYGETALMHISQYEGNSRTEACYMAQSLINAGADLDIVDNFKQSALMYATDVDRTDILEILIIFDLLSGLKSDISFYKSFLIFVGVSLIDSINILPQNILVSDVGYGYVTKYLGENFQLGVIAKLYLRFLIFISSISIAIIYNVYIHLQRKIF